MTADRTFARPLHSTREILEDAFAHRYGVGAFNVFNDLSLAAVLLAAQRQRAPVIVQTSVKTVRAIGARVLGTLVRAMAEDVSVPVALHLDHCPDRSVVTECLAEGWTSVLFDGSHLDFEENLRQTAEVVLEAHRCGAFVEGEIESITGVEDGVGSDEISAIYDLDLVVRFIEETGVDFFAPAVGTAHGVYRARPELDAGRVTAIVDRVPIPQVLHGGTGLDPEQFADLIGRGCAKVNVSTALKVSYMRANLDLLREAERADRWDPPSLFRGVTDAVVDVAEEYMLQFGSAGRA